jgi:adenine-specific DNA-methyltransferase
MNQIIKDDTQSMTQDIVKTNVEQLKNLFPEVFTENKIDFEALQSLLGEYVDKEDERYSFNWKGKANARRIAQTPSSATLRPVKEESKNWDKTENLYIEGDNLEVLKLLQKSYHNKIKMIYIDPPYNTGNDFVYSDDFKDNLKNYLDITKQVSDEGKRLSTNSETSGRYHSNWLSMMFPRLKLARNLLSTDGVIFISIDDNEVHNLRKICDEIFGEENFVANVVWKRKRGRDNSAKYFSKSHEYLLIYAKNLNDFTVNYLELDENTKKAYTNPDNDPRGIYRTLAVWARGTQGGVKYEFVSKSGKVFTERLWLMSKESLEKLDSDNKLIFHNDNVYRKLFINENKGKIPETLWENVSNAANASDEIKSIFNSIIFDTPKPVPYILETLKIATNKESLILDFFSGSSTTANAVIQLNAEDGGRRKFVMVQLPELLEENSEAYKAGFKNIAEIGKERIRRIGDKIVMELKEKQSAQKLLADEVQVNPDDLDIGFKVFKLDTSNIKTWDSSTENIQQALLDSVSNIKSERSQEDVLYEVLLKYGLDLTLPIEEFEQDGKKLYSVGFGSLVICLGNDIDISIAEKIVEIKDTKKPETMNVIFKDNGFKDDVVKTNTIQLLTKHGVESVRSI